MLFRNFNDKFMLVFAAIAFLFVGGANDSFDKPGYPLVAVFLSL